MSVRIEKKNIVYESVSMTAIEPNSVFTDKEAVKEYMREHPFPETKHYTAEDLFGDTHSEGMWTLPNELTEEQECYIEDMTRHFL